MTTEVPRCQRHPDVETRLRCSSCDAPICPDCWQDAAVGFHCPDCAAARSDRARAAGERIAAARGEDTPARKSRIGIGGVSTSPQSTGVVAVRALGIGLGSAMVGGLVLGPVLVGGTFFLLSAGIIGWLVARAVFWATNEQSTAFVRAAALTFAGFAVAVGLATAGASPLPVGITALAYPAALWGGWLVVRQRS